MKYINYVTALVMMIFPHDYPFDPLCMEWIANHKENGKLTKVPTWEYVCRFAAELSLEKTEEDGKPSIIRETVEPETIDSSQRYQKPNTEIPQNPSKSKKTSSTPDDIKSIFKRDTQGSTKEQ